MPSVLLVLSTRGGLVEQILNWPRSLHRAASADGDSVKNLIAAVDKHKQGHTWVTTPLSRLNGGSVLQNTNNKDIVSRQLSLRDSTIKEYDCYAVLNFSTLTFKYQPENATGKVVFPIIYTFLKLLEKIMPFSTKRWLKSVQLHDPCESLDTGSHIL